MDSRTATIAITTISSINVKPRRALPLRIRFPIAVLVHGFRVNVEDVLAAPGIGSGLILHAALSPIGIVRHRIFWDAPEEFELAALPAPADSVGQLHAF